MLIVLLPAMDGTGILLRPFVDLLPNGIDVKVISYPEDTYLTYEQLAERVLGVVPRSEPYVIIAESYSGPVACLLAAHPVGNLQAVVFVASFVSLPWGRMGRWIAKVLPTALFRSRAPAWMLRWLLMDADTRPEMISEAQAVIARVRPEVLAQRLRDSLSADFAPILRDCTVRIVCLSPESDRLGLDGFAGSSPQSPASKPCRLPAPTLSFSALPPVVWLFFRRLECSAIRENVSGRWIGSALTKLTYPAPCSE